MTKSENQQATKQQPLLEKLSAGTSAIAIFRNETKDGRVFFKAALDHAYFDKDDQTWKPTNSYSMNELADLATVALDARRVMVKLIRAQQPTASGQPAEDDSSDE